MKTRQNIFKISVIVLAALFLLMFFLVSCEDDADNCDCKCPPCGDDDDTQEDDDASDDDNSPEPQASEWFWIPVKGAVCRDGSDTGMGVRFFEHSDKIAIYLEATGICAFKDQCNEENANFSENFFKIYSQVYLDEGLFNAAREENPLRDWNHVYLPGCTGDMFAGNNPEGHMIGNREPQAYVGFLNLQKMVAKIQEIFTFEPSRILVWGLCSGGNGTLVAYPLVADAFPDTPVTLLNDSGGLADMDEAFPPCLQWIFRNIFNVEPSLPEDCEDCTLPNGDGMSNIQAYLAEAYPQGNFGFMSTLSDLAIRLVWGFGQDHCLRIFTAEEDEDYLLPEDVFAAALRDLRDNHLLPTGRWSTFYTNGKFHTFASIIDSFYYEFGDDNPPLEWISKLVAGEVPPPVEMTDTSYDPPWEF